jgi:hypothetical protein
LKAGAAAEAELRRTAVVGRVLPIAELRGSGAYALHEAARGQYLPVDCFKTKPQSGHSKTTENERSFQSRIPSVIR